ncbi:FAD-dependent monooxygenase (plasmid) [Mesorhizobium sp. AR10]|uniref:flavin-dependent monooxygenase QhpG n=1 Tax=Mesorhizobium sp. AR10 TaxID=2865839 RepID=UPI0021603FBC|nr:FAD-dependent monooxygenase [Mesorhizobium sp. AR10]UVK35727.1 FAD-dependent monooxygenase [Mesorhizobium sp. AR10]
MYGSSSAGLTSSVPRRRRSRSRSSMEKEERRFDCVILGGGLSGSVAAVRLSALGLTVCLLQDGRATVVGTVESISHGAIAVLERMGLARALRRAEMIRSIGSRVHWGGETIEVDAAAGSNLIVCHSAFRAALLDDAECRGVEVHRGTSISSVDRGGHGWRVEAETPDGLLRVGGRFMVFAGGRHGHRCGRRRRMSPATLALTGRFRAPAAMPARSYVEAGAEWWCWAAPLPADLAQITVFTAPDHPALKAGSNLESGLRRLLARSGSLAAFADADLDGPLQACDASRTMVFPAIGDDFVAVGDAAFTIDPLSSQGVVKAVVSAQQAAVAVNTLLRRPDLASSARDFYLARVREAVDWDRRTSGLYYARQAACMPTPFWVLRSGTPEPQARCALEPHLALHFDDATAMVDTPVLCDELIERHPALTHPGLQRPIAFVGNTPVGALLRGLPRTATASQLAERWSAALGRHAAARFVNLLWDRAVLVTAGR